MPGILGGMQAAMACPFCNQPLPNVHPAFTNPAMAQAMRALAGHDPNITPNSGWSPSELRQFGGLVPPILMPNNGSSGWGINELKQLGAP